MNINQYVDSLSMPLPEDILKRKWAGDLEGAVKAIDMRLEKELPAMLRERLICERERIRRLPTQYPWNRAEALAKLREIVPSVTDDQFDRWELEGRIDFIYINGEKRYFVRCHRSIAKHPELVRQAGREVKPDNDWLDPMIREIKEKGSLTRRITMETSVYVDEEDFVPGEYLAHLPYPMPSAQQSDIRLLEGEPDGFSPADAGRTLRLPYFPIRNKKHRSEERCFCLAPSRGVSAHSACVCASHCTHLQHSLPGR